MPDCGSQIILCDLPVRFDTYKGCSHGCKYCFVTRKKDMSNIEIKETHVHLENFIAGKRSESTSWCDWDIPLHWGGVSDPFQPIELKHRISLECLKVLAKTNKIYTVPLNLYGYNYSIGGGVNVKVNNYDKKFSYLKHFKENILHLKYKANGETKCLKKSIKNMSMRATT